MYVHVHVHCTIQGTSELLKVAKERSTALQWHSLKNLPQYDHIRKTGNTLCSLKVWLVDALSPPLVTHKLLT